ncbi:unnamed protein product [Phytomonas sp. EM1]|nr:unnamed protein product [Phytomonas sp. EM1]|eukprot:CCW59834.1 unnamed protein product [Phytomonas sp. isolate EM1]
MEQIESVKKMIDNLRSEDPELRLSSMRGIHLIAATLGPERTRDELLLYLTDYLDDNDDVLRVFANALGTMLPEVGGVAYITSLLNPLEILCSLDEVTVRDEIVASLEHIGENIFRGTSSKVEMADKARMEYLNLLERLSQGTPQCRSIVCSLIATVYPSVTSSERANLISMFKALCADEEIMVRRAACVAMGAKLAGILSPKTVVDLVPVLVSFSKATSDGVRLQVVPTAAAVLKVLPEVHHGSVLGLIKVLSADNSWRVRYMTADSLGILAAAMTPPDVVRFAIPIFRALCQDTEPEIRASAVFNMEGMVTACRDLNGKKDILITGTRLISDESSHVRMSLASAVLKSVANVPKELWDTTIIPTCTRLLNDTEADVRLALVSGFSSIGNTSEARDLAPKLVPVIIALASDPKWRLRETVVSQVPSVISALGQNAEDILDVCIERLTDRVATIRDTAAQSCCRLVGENGPTWAMRVLFPRLEPIAKDKNYLHRVSLCHLYAGLADVAAFDSSTCETAVWPILVQLRDDPVANVRLNVCRAVLALHNARKVSFREAHIILDKLKSDASDDVRELVTQITENGKVPPNRLKGEA